MANIAQRMAEMLEKQVDLLKDAGLEDVAYAAAEQAERLRLLHALGAAK